ncbi:MAG: GNAT family N-acetyltransferase [Flavobacteriales bacterium]|jgi:putative acetyltransferase|uniref:GNAT family N-acetyltransferase n=1 Tax=Candidatus Ulvibacter alkanivorans TaxID=2267620 RepID=UPI000DF355D3|nr:GNAT family N-acetyltransferase [Candidatus Ulvibacter alkanivorans]MCH2488616.1 GNAT family N-acetyltransferase [Flavobacteriales bacterium]
MDIPLIRPIEKKDNPHIAAVIRSVLIDFGVPKKGTAYADAALDAMFETYQEERSAYFVVEEDGKIIGGAGVAPLANYNGNVCELQKMYYLPEARKRGIGTHMINLCLIKAREFNFDQCYLETMPYMTAAQKLYERSGFRFIDGPMGDTGHYSCPVHMLIDL